LERSEAGMGWWWLRGHAVVVVVVELQLGSRCAAVRCCRAGCAGHLRCHPLDPRQCDWPLDLGSGQGLGGIGGDWVHGGAGVDRELLAAGGEQDRRAVSESRTS
jgi:hypothetical protein